MYCGVANGRSSFLCAYVALFFVVIGKTSSFLYMVECVTLGLMVFIVFHCLCTILCLENMCACVCVIAKNILRCVKNVRRI